MMKRWLVYKFVHTSDVGGSVIQWSCDIATNEHVEYVTSLYEGNLLTKQFIGPVKHCNILQI